MNRIIRALSCVLMLAVATLAMPMQVVMAAAPVIPPSAPITIAPGFQIVASRGQS